MKSADFWGVAPCSLVRVYWQFMLQDNIFVHTRSWHPSRDDRHDCSRQQGFKLYAYRTSGHIPIHLL